MKFKAEDIRNIFLCNKVEGYEVIREPDWESDGEYENGYLIFKFDDRYYSKYAGRWCFGWGGGFFYDWEHWSEETECQEVRPVQVTITKWESV